MTIGGPPDFDKLEEYLRALAYGSRLELMVQLRLPRSVSDIRLAPRQAHGGENPDRAMARQSVQEHLGKLLEVGVVVPWEGDGTGKRGKEYVLNPQRLYHILEELRKVGTIAPGDLTRRDDTINLGDVRPPRLEPGPRLVLVHGLHEGKAFPLRRGDLQSGRGWVIGRKTDLHVSLAYDPYVSLENSEVTLESGEFRLLDLRNSKNGTWINWRRLGMDESVTLHAGDVIGVGRSLLVFRDN